MPEHTNITSKEGTSHKSNRIPRAKWMDYQSPSVMMITIVTNKRLPLLGKLHGENIILTELGQKVAAKIGGIPHTSQRYRFVAMNMIAKEMFKES